MPTKRVLPFPQKAPMISRSEWNSFIRTRKMLDETRENLTFLENEWEAERRRFEKKLLTGFVIEHCGKMG